MSSPNIVPEHCEKIKSPSAQAQTFITIVGAGPGAADLITVRGLRALEEADVVLYAGSLVHPVHLQACKEQCESFDTSSLALEEQVRIMATAAHAGKKVVRLHTGDPAMFGAINEQIRGLKEQGLGVHIVPGVSSVFAAAAALGTELTSPEVSQSVVLSRTPGRTPMPPKEKAGHFAASGATLVFFLSAGNIEKLMQELMQEGGLSPKTPAAVVYRVSWPDERILRGTVEDIARQCKEAGIGRQALILVGEALGEQHTASLLYDGAFSHGYRNSLQEESFAGSCALYAFTDAGVERAQQIASALALPATVYSTRPAPAVQEGLYPVHYIEAQDFDRHMKEQWQEHSGHIFVGATGIAVRKVASLLRHKSVDPAVVVCTENGAHSISLVSGHLGGANALSKRIARITGGQAVVSTASDGRSLPAFDAVAAQYKARIVNVQAVKTLNAALLHDEDVAFYGPQAVYDAHYAQVKSVYFISAVQDISTKFAVIWQEPQSLSAQETTLLAEKALACLYISPKAFVLGMGCRKHMHVADFEAKVQSFLAEQGISLAQVAAFATCDVKAEEEAMLSLSKKYAIDLELHSAEALDAVPVPTPSVKVKEKVGTASVCEAAALLTVQLWIDKEAGQELVQGSECPKATLYCPKKSLEDMTLAVARLPHGMAGSKVKAAMSTTTTIPTASISKVLVVGLGSGAAQHITPEVQEALEQCDVVAGYTKYVDFIREQVAHKPLIQNGMKGEVQRCTEALQVAAKGKSVCMVCSGDPGILAMAGLLFELKARDAAFAEVEISVLPGITAASLAAASLGAPLQNGFSLVSLSDLLVPAEEVRQNVRAVAASALPVVLYNPAGKKRRALLAEALNIFTAARGEEVLCAYVRHAGRPQEEKWLGTLKDFPEHEVDMSTLVLIGSARTLQDGHKLYEARGYADKYL